MAGEAGPEAGGEDIKDKRVDRAERRLSKLSDRLKKKLDKLGAESDTDTLGVSTDEDFESVGKEVDQAIRDANARIDEIGVELEGELTDEKKNELRMERANLMQMRTELDELMTKFLKKRDRVAGRLQKSGERLEGRSEDAVRLEELDAELAKPDLDEATRATYTAEQKEILERERHIAREQERLAKAENRQDIAEAEIGKSEKAERYLENAMAGVEEEDPVEEQSGEEPSEGGDTPEDGEETPDDGEEVLTLQDRLANASKGLVEGIVDDLQDKNNIIKQGMVTAKSFLVMLLAGKGGKSTAWMTQFNKDELDLLEYGIGMQVARNEAGPDKGKAKVEEDGGVKIKWVKPDPEKMPAMRASKILVEVFGDQNPGIGYETTFKELVAKRDEHEAGSEGYANMDRLITVMEANGKPEDDTKVIAYLEKNYTEIWEDLSDENDGIVEGDEEEEISWDPVEGQDMEMEEPVVEAAEETEAEEVAAEPEPEAEEPESEYDRTSMDEADAGFQAALAEDMGVEEPVAEAESEPTAEGSEIASEFPAELTALGITPETTLEELQEMRENLATENLQMINNWASALPNKIPELASVSVEDSSVERGDSYIRKNINVSLRHTTNAPYDTDLFFGRLAASAAKGLLENTTFDQARQEEIRMLLVENDLKNRFAGRSESIEEWFRDSLEEAASA